MQSYVNKLKEINEIPEVVAAIEQFIIDNDFQKKGMSYYDLTQKSRAIARAFDNLCISLKADYSFDTNHAHLYFSMDKTLFSKLHQNSIYSIKEDIYFSDIGGKYFYLCGANILTVYNRNYEKIIDFLEENMDLFPSSTKKYIVKKKKDLQNETKTSFDKVTNDFELRMLENSLGSVFDYKLIKKYISKFKLITDKADKAISFLNLLISVKNKYSNSSDERVEKYIENISKEFYSYFGNSAFGYHYHSEDREGAKKIITKTLSSKPVIDEMIELSLANNNSTLIYFFNIYAKKHHRFKELNSALRKILEVELYHGHFKFKSTNDDLKDLIVEDSKRQWIVNTNPINDINQDLFAICNKALDIN